MDLDANHTSVNSSNADNTLVIFTTWSAVITFFASIVITTTLVGNILVIAAVCAERKLRKVGNYFLVNLGISDLLVGVLVTPFALALDISRNWNFGAKMCYFWTSMDVLCCTASIVNLCVISFDRYNAIADPLRYAVKRTPSRAAVMIAFIWVYSSAIALPPLFGWGTDVYTQVHTQCRVTQNRGYTVFSILFSFVLPSIIMLCLHCRMFKATLTRRKIWMPGSKLRSPIEGKNKNNSGSRVSVYVNITDSMRRYHAREEELQLERKSSRIDPVNPEVGYRLMQNGVDKPKKTVSSLPPSPIPPRLCSSMESLADTISTSATPPARTNILSSADVSITEPSALRTQVLLDDHKDSADSPMEVFSDSTTTSSPKQRRRRFRKTRGKSQQLPVRRSEALKKPASPAPNTLSLPSGFDGMRSSSATSITDSGLSDIERSSYSRNTSPTPRMSITSLVNQLRPHRLRVKRNCISLSQEKRAAKTLGIIMGCFVFCWLPFFIVTLIKPFLSEEVISPIAVRLVTWLGYFNSALNPIIYTFFNQDFRKAFKRIVCFA